MAVELLDGLKRNPYELLEVTKECSAKDLKRAYRKKARECHPDKNRDDAQSEDKFRELHKSFEFLSDTAKRERYNAFLEAEELREKRYREMDAVKRELADKLKLRELERPSTNRTNSDAATEGAGFNLKRLRKENMEFVKQMNVMETHVASRQDKAEQKVKAERFVRQTSASAVKASMKPSVRSAGFSEDNNTPVFTRRRDVIGSIPSTIRPTAAQFAEFEEATLQQLLLAAAQQKQSKVTCNVDRH